MKLITCHSCSLQLNYDPEAKQDLICPKCFLLMAKYIPAQMPLIEFADMLKSKSDPKDIREFVASYVFNVLKHNSDSGLPEDNAKCWMGTGHLISILEDCLLKFIQLKRQ